MRPNRSIRASILGMCVAAVFSVSPGWGQTLPAKEEDDLKTKLEELEKRLEALKRELFESEPAEISSPEGRPVDLTDDEVAAVDEDIEHVLARPWERNIHIGGFGAVGFVHSGADGTRPNGGFWVKESTLFVDATAWENVAFFFEIQVNRLERTLLSSSVPAKYTRIFEISCGGGATICCH